MAVKLETRNLNYKIGNARILNGISIAVEEKKMVGIIGPNGSGKTTLLKHIYRVLPAAAKTVYLNHKEIENYTYGQSAREMTVVKQENSADFDFTVEHMVLLGRAPYHRSFESFSEADRRIANAALHSIGMEQYASRTFAELSGGEKQRVLIARSLTQQADIFILDEPTNHLDVHFQWELMKLIKSLNTTVLGVFHELNLAAQFCDYLYVLSQGKIAAAGPPEEILTGRLLAEVFGVDAEILTRAGRRPYIMINQAISAGTTA